MKQIIIYLLFLLTVSSCGLSEESTEIENSDVELQLLLEIPESQTVTFGLRSSDANTVRCVDILIFDQDSKFIERVLVNDVSGTGTTKSLKFRIPTTSSSRTFHIIANGRDATNSDIINFSSLTVGMQESVAIPLLTTNALEANNSPQAPLVMWGRVSLPSINSNTTLPSISMLRAVAAISVSSLSGNAYNGLNDFTLTGFTILKSSSQGRVAPAAYTEPAQTPSTATFIATGTTFIDYVNASGTGVWSSALESVTPDLYLYERAAYGLSVIVRGQYKGVDGYYKIWIKPADALYIVRNHRYLVQISKVFGTGYVSLDKAIAADYSANLFFDIIDNDDDIVDMIADGKSELGVSSPITINGNVEGATIGFVLSTNTAESVVVTSDVDWITDLSLIGSGNRKELKGTFSGATISGESIATGTITVRCGSLVRQITVTFNI